MRSATHGGGRLPVCQRQRGSSFNRHHCIAPACARITIELSAQLSNCEMNARASAKISPYTHDHNATPRSDGMERNVELRSHRIASQCENESAVFGFCIRIRRAVLGLRSLTARTHMSILFRRVCVGQQNNRTYTHVTWRDQVVDLLRLTSEAPIRWGGGADAAEKVRRPRPH